MHSSLLHFILSASALFLSLSVATPVCAAAELGAPPGWEIRGDDRDKFETGVDPQMTHNGKPSAFIISKAEKIQGLASLKQKIAATNYIGKRLRLSGWLKTENVVDASGLWMRVDNAERKALELDNMEKRPVKGTTDWKQYSVVLDVPRGAETIHFGFILSQTGKLWVSDLHLEPVSKDTPSTNMLSDSRKPPDEPVNLDFSKTR
jgi:hypothetical protein